MTPPNPHPDHPAMSEQVRGGVEPQQGDLRVWWVPQLPMKSFEVDVPDLLTADLLLTTLGRYDAFQFEYKVKPDYCNAGGLVQYDAENREWWDWECPDTCDSFDVVRVDPAALRSAAAAARAQVQA